MDEFINRDKLIEDIKLKFCEGCNPGSRRLLCRGCHTSIAIGELKGVPTADVVEVKHGEWKKISVASKEYGYGQVYYQHSSCKISPTELYQSPYERCPRCGAKMDGDKK